MGAREVFSLGLQNWPQGDTGKIHIKKKKKENLDTKLLFISVLNLAKVIEGNHCSY